MFLTISTGEELGDKVVQIDVGAEETIETVKCILEAETGVSQADQVLVHNGKEVTEANGATLATFGVKDNDIMMLLSRKAMAGGGGSGGGRAPGAGAQIGPDGMPVNLEAFVDHLASDPVMMQQVERQNPELAHALKSKDLNLVRQIFSQINHSPR